MRSMHMQHADSTCAHLAEGVTQICDTDYAEHVSQYYAEYIADIQRQPL